MPIIRANGRRMLPLLSPKGGCKDYMLWMNSCKQCTNASYADIRMHSSITVLTDVEDFGSCAFTWLCDFNTYMNIRRRHATGGQLPDVIFFISALNFGRCRFYIQKSDFKCFCSSVNSNIMPMVSRYLLLNLPAA